MVSNGVNIPLVELINAGIEINGERLSAGITFNVTRGEFVCLHGPTGSGKSLALSMIAGILRPTFGEVRVAGDCLNNFTEREMAIVRRSMGIMMQECLLLDNRTILENVMLPSLAAEESYGKARVAAMNALDKCGIADLAQAIRTICQPDKSRSQAWRAPSSTIRCLCWPMSRARIWTLTTLST